MIEVKCTVSVAVRFLENQEVMAFPEPLARQHVVSVLHRGVKSKEGIAVPAEASQLRDQWGWGVGRLRFWLQTLRSLKLVSVAAPLQQLGGWKVSGRCGADADLAFAPSHEFLNMQVAVSRGNRGRSSSMGATHRCGIAPGINRAQFLVL